MYTGRWLYLGHRHNFDRLIHAKWLLSLYVYQIWIPQRKGTAPFSIHDHNKINHVTEVKNDTISLPEVVIEILHCTLDHRLTKETKSHLRTPC